MTAESHKHQTHVHSVIGYNGGIWLTYSYLLDSHAIVVGVCGMQISYLSIPGPEVTKLNG